jgi:DNA gyrase subunit B
MDSARLRAKQKKEKEAAKKIKDTLGVSSKPAKLVDCQNEGPGTELLIAEGDSAGGTIKQARNGAWQALFPVRGVTLNCYGAKAEKILSNNEFADLANAMRGGGIGKYFDMDKRRYDRIGIYTDADEDGNYIRSLLLVFIYTCFPGMIEAGKVFAGCPPLYSITYTKGPKKGQTVHVADEAERDRFVDRYVKGGNDLGDLNIQRSKGLGEDNADEIEWLDPKTRKVRVITVDDVDEAKAQAEGALQLLFSARQEDRAARRVWIDDTFEKEVD